MPDTAQLSGRETQVIRHLLQGRSNKQIALALGISERTVEFHLRNIYTKFDVASRMELALKLGNTPGSAISRILGEPAVEKADALHENGEKPLSLRVAITTIAKEPEMKMRWTWYMLAGLVFGAAYWHYFSLTGHFFNVLDTGDFWLGEGVLFLLAMLTDFGVWLVPAVLPALLEFRRSGLLRYSVLAVVTVWLSAVLGYYINYLFMLAFVGLPNMEYLVVFRNAGSALLRVWPAIFVKLILVKYLKWTLFGALISAASGLISGSVLSALLGRHSRGQGLSGA